MPHLSIIVRLTSDNNAFETTVASVLRHLPADSELVVIHDGNYGDPHDLEFEGVKFFEACHEESTIHSVLRASTLVDSDVIHVLECGTEVDEGWCEQPLDLLISPEVASVSPILAYEDRPAQIATLGIGYSRTFRPLLVGHDKMQHQVANEVRRITGPTRWAGFYRTELLSILHASEWQLNESAYDLQLALCFQKLGYQTRVAADCIISIDRAANLNRRVQSIGGDSLHEVFCQFHHRPDKTGLGNKLIAILFDCCESRLSINVMTNSIARFSVDSNRIASDFRLVWDHICWRIRDLDESKTVDRASGRRAA